MSVKIVDDDWAAGVEAGKDPKHTGLPPVGVDEFSFLSGYIEGRAELKKRQEAS